MGVHRSALATFVALAVLATGAPKTRADAPPDEEDADVEDPSRAEEDDDLDEESEDDDADDADDAEEVTLEPEPDTEATGSSEEIDGDGFWDPSTAATPEYLGVRAESPPTIDGVLDDEIWSVAPRDKRFYDELSKPYGGPARHPTSVQVAYDDDALYVAFRCEYTEPFEFVDSPPLSDADPHDMVFVYIDGELDRASAFAAAVSPMGYGSDFEIFNNGADRNFNWNGQWEAKTHRNGKNWTAEFRIPWSTVRLRERPGSFDIGINFRRWANPTFQIWAPPPPGNQPVPSFFGTLKGLEDAAARDILTLTPYGVVELTPQGLPSYRDESDPGFLRNFDGSDRKLSVYGGFFGRVLPGKGLRVDFMLNPDFSEARPDSAVANLDRFELYFPERRHFFLEANPTYDFGPDGAKLFYSRRVGFRQRSFGLEEVPLIGGANATYRRGSTTIGGMHLMQQELPGPIEGGENTTRNQSNLTMLRLKHQSGGSYLGLMGMNLAIRGVSNRYYSAAGVDGATSFLDNHLRLSGSAAATQGLVPLDGYEGEKSLIDQRHQKESSGSLYASAEFNSQEAGVGVSYLDIGENFNAIAGFYRLINARSLKFFSVYRPQVRNDLVRSAEIGLDVDVAVTRDSDSLISDTIDNYWTLRLSNLSTIKVTFRKTFDLVRRFFFLGGNRIKVQPGFYESIIGKLSYSTDSIYQRFSLNVDYVEGNLFGTYQRVLSPRVDVYLNRLRLQATYQYFRLRPGRSNLTDESNEQSLGGLTTAVVDGNRVSLAALFAPTPDLRFSAFLEFNTFDPTATMQLLASYRLDRLSSLILVGSRSAPALDAWQSDPMQTVLLKFEYALQVL